MYFDYSLLWKKNGRMHTSGVVVVVVVVCASEWANAPFIGFHPILELTLSFNEDEWMCCWMRACFGMMHETNEKQN